MAIKLQVVVKKAIPLAIALIIGSMVQAQSISAEWRKAYQEPYRPQYHFTPLSGWMNDPNGMVYIDGEYHLFYQYYPDSTRWGPMHWGHAVSKNLVDWDHLPIALYPDSLGYIFSGSAVVDHQNTSGLGIAGKPPLVAIFTYHDMAAEKRGSESYQSQGIAYSNDRGRTWKKYPGNPVLPNPGRQRDFRDPKVIWHEASNRWMMALAVKDHVEFWSSSNLLQWTKQSEWGKQAGAHGGVWECPDLFPIQVMETGEMLWVLLLSINPGGPNGGSATQYFVGSFDGKDFVAHPSFQKDIQQERAVWLDWGRDNYAGVTWSNAPVDAKRRLFIGWMSNWDYAQEVPTLRWRSAMTLPRQLTLHATPEGYRLRQNPVPQLSTLFGKATTIGPMVVTKPWSSQAAGMSIQPTMRYEIALSAEAGTTAVMEWVSPAGDRYRLRWNTQTGMLESDRTGLLQNGFSPVFAQKPHTAPMPSGTSTLRLDVWMDASSIEVFAGEGAVVLTDLMFPQAPFADFRIFGAGGAISLSQVNCYPLRSFKP